MAAPVYVVRRTKCYPQDIEAALNELSQQGWEIFSVSHHCTIGPDAAHEGKYCRVDIVAVKKD